MSRMFYVSLTTLCLIAASAGFYTGCGDANTCKSNKDCNDPQKRCVLKGGVGTCQTSALIDPDASTTPDDNTTTPDDNTTTPDDNTTTPDDNTTTPDDNTT
ncbi:MAG: hypothetical protein AAGJ35_12505, partial [Myxococcota bacterium]